MSYRALAPAAAFICAAVYVATFVTMTASGLHDRLSLSSIESVLHLQSWGVVLPALLALRGVIELSTIRELRGLKTGVGLLGCGVVLVALFSGLALSLPESGRLYRGLVLIFGVPLGYTLAGIGGSAISFSVLASSSRVSVLHGGLALLSAAASLLSFNFEPAMYAVMLLMAAWWASLGIVLLFPFLRRSVAS